jgi:hypothetical protein
VAEPELSFMALADSELLRILESQGFRELVTAHLFA